MTPTLQCESPIEERMAAALATFFHPGVDWCSQEPITACGQRFRVDFQAVYAGRRVVIECDGRDFHDYKLDRIRDAMMLTAGRADDVFRFRGSDIFLAMEDCLKCLGLYAPFLSSPTAAVPDPDAKLLASAHLPHLAARPVYRCRMPLGEGVDARRRYMASRTAVIIGRTSDGECCIGEFRSPDWDRTYRGQQRAMVIGDVLACMVYDMERAHK